MQKDRPQSGNQLSCLLHELVFLGYHSAYPYSFASYLYSRKILEPYVAATMQMHSDAVFSSVGASRRKTFIKHKCMSTNFCILKLISDFK